jgi:primosomal protein N''
MAQEVTDVSAEHELLARCIEEAHETLRIMPGVDENGPALVWFADHLRDAYSRNRQS